MNSLTKTGRILAVTSAWVLFAIIIFATSKLVAPAVVITSVAAYCVLFLVALTILFIAKNSK